MNNMAFQIGVTSDDVIFTSDRPFVEWFSHDNELSNRPKALIFPLTSRIVVYMYPQEDIESIGWNYSFRLDEERIRDIQINIAICARNWIYTRERLTDEQIGLIKAARKRMK